MQHITIYREAGRYAGWPANYGIWTWGNEEIVAGFLVGYHNINTAGLHSIDKSRPLTTMQARSTDSGLTWAVETMPVTAPGNRALSAVEHSDQGEFDPYTAENPPQLLSQPLDFHHPDFALLCARTGLASGAVSWFYASYDRCRTWQGPYRMPLFDTGGVSARTDVVITGQREAWFMLSVAKSNGREGRVCAVRTRDGGQTFHFDNWIGPEPEGYSIMPASVRSLDDQILTAVRRRDGDRCWIDLYKRDASHWHKISTPVSNTGRGSNPPAMLRLADGRLCLVYGYRDAPYGIRATISADDGRTWGDAIILRDDGGHPDLGYPRAVQRPDGTVVAVYYFNDVPDGERYIAATLFQP